VTVKSDVVVIGGGVIGSSIALQMASAGLTVTVVERDSIGNHASGFVLGLLNPTNETGKIESLNHESYLMHRDQLERIQDESGVDAQVRITPHLELALTEEDLPELRAEVDRINQFDAFHAEGLSPEDVIKAEPRITEENFGGVLVESVFMLDSYNYTLAVAQVAEKRGVSFVTSTVRDLSWNKSAISKVVTDQEEYVCGSVIFAMGPWTGTAGVWLDVDIPIVPQKGEIVRVAGFDKPLNHHLHGFHLNSSCSVVQKGDDQVWLAATKQDGTGFDTSPSSEALESLTLRGLRMIPALEEQEVILQTACLRPVSPDGDPILGRVPGKEGAFIATGTGGKGILLAPLVGRAIADLVATGVTEFDIGQFGLDRFA